MNKFVVKNEGPPPSLVVYRRQVLAQSTRQGDLWLTRYPLSHELFKENLGVDYAGCGALWREAQPGALPPRVAQEQFNALWKTRIKALKPKEQPKAVEALRLSLVAQAQVQHNKADEALVAQLPRILVHERAALVGMLPGPARIEHQRRLDVLEVVCTAWAQLPATAKSVTALGQLFQKAETPAADAPSTSSPSAVATVASSQAATSSGSTHQLLVLVGCIIAGTIHALVRRPQPPSDPAVWAGVMRMLGILPANESLIFNHHWDPLMCESLTAMNRFITVREEARALNGTALGDDVVAAMACCGSVMNDWLQGAATRAEALRACCTTASRCNSDVTRLRSCISMARYRLNKGSGAEARTVCTGLGMKLRWDSINHSAPGPISPEHLAYLACAIRMYGWIQLGLVIGPLGYEGTAAALMMDQLLVAMPVIAVRAYRSRHVYIFDGIDIPAVPLWSQLLPPDVCASAPITATEDAAHLESIPNYQIPQSCLMISRGPQYLNLTL